jgi:acetylornithine deacetylase/succinyl-diaminopimelate desuccinylase-like protein
MKSHTVQEIVQQQGAELVSLLSAMIQAGAREGGTSGLEGDRARLMIEELKKFTENVHMDDFGNAIGALGELHSPKKTIWFIGHIDTVAKGEWGEDAYKPKVVGNQLFGRGSSDQLAGVVSSIVALKVLKNQENELKEAGIRVIVMGNPHEEDCEGESIKYLLAEAAKEVSQLPEWLMGLPNIIVTTEPTSTEDGTPRPYFGHRGRYLYEVSVKGETGHGSVIIKVPAGEVFSRVIARIYESVKGPDSVKFGIDTYAFTNGSITSPSFNAHTEVAKWNIDFRIAPTSDPEFILDDMKDIAEEIRQQIAEEKKVAISEIPLVTFSVVAPEFVTHNGHRFTGVQELPGPWLAPEHPLRAIAAKTYAEVFGFVPPFDKPRTSLAGARKDDQKEGDQTIRDFYNFSTDLTGLAQLIRRAAKDGSVVPEIAFMGLGSGIEEQAHRNGEWCPINSLANATAYYVALVRNLVQ